MFFCPYSERYKLTRQNPKLLELSVVILYQELFMLKPVNYELIMN